MLGNGTIDLYWGRCGRELDNRSLLGKDCAVGYVAVDLYWGRCDREWVDKSLLWTEW